MDGWQSFPFWVRWMAYSRASKLTWLVATQRFLFSPLPWGWFPIWLIFFNWVWFNHQPVRVYWNVGRVGREKVDPDPTVTPTALPADRATPSSLLGLQTWRLKPKRRWNFWVGIFGSVGNFCWDFPLKPGWIFEDFFFFWGGMVRLRLFLFVWQGFELIFFKKSFRDIWCFFLFFFV